MYKGLEEIKRLKWGLDITREEWINLCEFIEKELKEKEELEKAFDTLSKDKEKVMKELSKEIEKNRALEIIKNKINWNITLNHFVKIGYISIEEYDLLKEVLL